MLRIIAGEARGRRLGTPRGRTTRPTSDRVREALFNILGNRVIDSLFLDLFAGSGAVGLEALSRGARRAVFVENNRQALNCLLANIKATGLEARGQVMALDARRALATLARRGETFDLIFSDPPYRQGWEELILPAVIPVLAPGGLVIMETAVAEAGPAITGLEITAIRIYGDTALNFYKSAGGLAGGVYDPD
ncbi:ribosomal RNA small subunit methyltransferase D [Moorella thermoacetica]|uniref:Ribosomal RNA small subunit methyltransferase D n=1 Tax=Neomoorella thermoacetica TaxID=1525 RepID=A0A1J5NRE7_NEOTH|nr:ribosomal RNA small subunit methyltransferase D [Moorella thermoacetica]